MDRILTFIKDFNVPRGDAGPEAPAGGLRACAAARRKYRTARAKTRPPGAPGRQSQRRLVDHRRAAARSNQDSEDNGAAVQYAAQQRIRLGEGESAGPRVANPGRKSLPDDACGRRKSRQRWSPEAHRGPARE